MERFRLTILAESRIRWKVYVRFGGEYWETYHRNMTRRRVLSLHNQIVKVVNSHFSNVAIPHQIAMLEQRTRELKALSIEILNLANRQRNGCEYRIWLPARRSVVLEKGKDRHDYPHNIRLQIPDLNSVPLEIAVLRVCRMAFPKVTSAELTTDTVPMRNPLAGMAFATVNYNTGFRSKVYNINGHYWDNHIKCR